MFGCSTSGTETEFEFPELKLIEFQPRQVELQSTTVSHIVQTTPSRITLRIAWEEILTPSNFSAIRIYRVLDNGSKLLLDETSTVSNTSKLIDVTLSDTAGINYDEVLNFRMTLVNKSNQESPLGKSNSISLLLSQAEPDQKNVTILNNSVQTISLQWISGLNGSAYPVFNISSLRNHMLDSISINIEKESSIGKWEKVLSVFGDSEIICEESGGQDQSRESEINLDSLKSHIRLGKVTVLDDFNKTIFPLGDFDQLFNLMGKYRMYFYLYKWDFENTQQFYMFRTNYTQEFVIN